MIANFSHSRDELSLRAGRVWGGVVAAKFCRTNNIPSATNETHYAARIIMNPVYLCTATVAKIISNALKYF